MKAKFRDGVAKRSDGVMLVPMLLHVLESDENGKPILCRVRYDEETIQLSEREGKNEFIAVWWNPSGRALVSDGLLDDLVETKIKFSQLKHEVATAKLEIASVTDANARLTEELEQKTVALRDLQKERDPARFERAVQERTRDLVQQLASVRASSASEIAQLKSRISELEASKRKLREALERLKERT